MRISLIFAGIPVNKRIPEQGAFKISRARHWNLFKTLVISTVISTFWQFQLQKIAKLAGDNATLESILDICITLINLPLDTIPILAMAYLYKQYRQQAIETNFEAVQE